MNGHAQIWALGGESCSAPEDTMVAYWGGIGAGADGLALALQPTADGHVAEPPQLGEAVAGISAQRDEHGDREEVHFWIREHQLADAFRTQNQVTAGSLDVVPTHFLKTRAAMIGRLGLSFGECYGHVDPPCVSGVRFRVDERPEAGCAPAIDRYRNACAATSR